MEKSFLAESTFNKMEIVEFLVNTNNGFASSCFLNDISEDRPSHTRVARWFKNHFPANTSQYMFRLAEAHCVQTSEMVELS